MITKLPFGIKNGKLTPISAVQSGLDCNCFCPECGSKLVAKKGNKKIHHFSHNQENDCQGAVETSLHLAAKEILSQTSEIIVPGIKQFSAGKLRYSKSVKLTFDEIIVEKRMGEFQPDIVGRIGDKELFIEIAVTHFIDTSKYEKLKKYGTATLEVDLSVLQDGFDYDELEELLLRGITNKKWIYNAKIERNRILFKEYQEQQLQIKNEKVKLHQSAKDIEISKYKNLKYKSIKNGWEIVKTYLHTNILCRSKMIDEAEKMQPTPISFAISRGHGWNGSFYGKGPNGKYIYLGNKKVIIYPPDNGRTDSNVKDGNVFYAQLHTILSKSVQSHFACKNCKYFRGSNYSLGSEFSDLEIICSYKKDNFLSNEF